MPYIDDITRKAVLFDTEISNDDNPNSILYHTMYAYTEALGYPALLRLRVEELYSEGHGNSYTFKRDYILQNIEEENISLRNRFSRPNHKETFSSPKSIADLHSLVKTYDKDFHAGKEVSSKLLDKNGKPRVFYHGTNADFTVINTKISAQDVSRSGAVNRDTGWSVIVNSDGIDETANKRKKWSAAYHSLKNINDMLESAFLVDTVVVDAPSSRMDKTATFIHHMYCPVTVNGEKGIAKLYITENIGDEHKFYLTKIEMESVDSMDQGKSGDPKSSIDSVISIADIYDFVKANNEKFEKNSEKPTKFEPRPVNEHDAVVFRNAKDSADGTGKAADVYVFMKPEMQLKSATDNIGTFDGVNKDITYSIAPISPREMLHNEISGLSDEELKKRGLLTYRRNIDKYNDLRRQREEILDSITFWGRM